MSRTDWMRNQLKDLKSIDAPWLYRQGRHEGITAKEVDHIMNELGWEYQAKFDGKTTTYTWVR